MDFNFAIFPAPKPTYSKESFQNKQFRQYEQLIEIETQDYQTKKKKAMIPCLLLPEVNKDYMSKKNFLVYFHGNAEDIGNSKEMLYSIQQRIEMNILIPEYPGYGIYKSFSSSAEQMEYDSEQVYKYLLTKLHYKNIYIFGRSIGTGPAVHVASNFQTNGLILMSAYTNIKAVAKGLVGILSFLVKDRFLSKDKISKVECPILLVHGKSDTLINYKQSQELFSQINPHLKEQGKVIQHYPQQMTHNEFDLDEDIIDKIEKILEKCEVDKLLVEFNKLGIGQINTTLKKPQVQPYFEQQNIQNKQTEESKSALNSTCQLKILCDNLEDVQLVNVESSLQQLVYDSLKRNQKQNMLTNQNDVKLEITINQIVYKESYFSSEQKKIKDFFNDGKPSDTTIKVIINQNNQNKQQKL